MTNTSRQGGLDANFKTLAFPKNYYWIEVPWGSLSESRNSNSTEIVARPLGLDIKPRQAGKVCVSEETLFRGCPRIQFQDQTAVPWNEIGLCGLLKETPTALPTLFSKH